VEVDEEPLSVEVDEEPLSLLPQEMTLKLKRNTKKIMSIYFTWITISSCGKNYLNI
jgi:hypothetical protein